MRRKKVPAEGARKERFVSISAWKKEEELVGTLLRRGGVKD